MSSSKVVTTTSQEKNWRLLITFDDDDIPPTRQFLRRFIINLLLKICIYRKGARAPSNFHIPKECFCFFLYYYPTPPTPQCPPEMFVANLWAPCLTHHSAYQKCL